MGKKPTDQMRGMLNAVDSAMEGKTQRIKELREENARLEQDNGNLRSNLRSQACGESLQVEVDRLRTRAEFAEDRVEELENDAQLDYDATKKVKAEREDLRAKVERLAEARDTWKGRAQAKGYEARDLRAENERLAGRRDAWMHSAEAQAKHARDLESELTRLRTAAPRVIGTDVPRTIEPDEVRKGQVVALRFDTVINGAEWYLDEPGYPASIDSMLTAADAIVLLADAPEDADEEVDLSPLDADKGLAPYRDVIRELAEKTYLPDHYVEEERPGHCCGSCPPIKGGGFDCTCQDNPRCELSDERGAPIKDYALRVGDVIDVHYYSGTVERDQEVKSTGWGRIETTDLRWLAPSNRHRALRLIARPARAEEG